MRRLLILVFLLLIFHPVNGENINPYNVDHAILKVVQEIRFYAKDADEIEVFSYIPQNDFFQNILKIEATKNFSIVKDEFGNEMMKFRVTPETNKIIINTTLEIYRRIAINNNISFPFQSNLTLLHSNFPLTFSYGNEFRKLAKAAQWIYTNLNYDESYKDKILSAKEVFVKKKGVCDEYSTLLIAFLRKLGYTASYEVGYAFDGRAFTPHGWVRVYGESLRDIDPTWCEMPVDALHIKFASLPDPVFNETKIIAKGINPEIHIYPQQVSFEILKYEEKPFVKSRFSFIEKTTNSNSYAIGKLSLYSDKCVLTTVNFGECIDENGKVIVKPYDYEKCMLFCGNARYFSVFSVSKINYPAKCKISAFVNMGKESGDEIEIKGKSAEKVWLSVEKNKVRRGESVKVQSNGHIFTLDGNYAFKQGEFKVYENTTIYAFYNGALEKKHIKVVENIPFEAFIENVSVENNTAKISVLIKNLMEKEISVTLQSDVDKILVNLLPKEVRIINITSKKLAPAQIKISYGDFSLNLNKYIGKEKTIRKEKAKKGNILSILSKLFSQLIEFLSSLF